MKKYEKKEDAASPVIGVMLMLVVTVVIAAVITAFATGMAGDSTSTTPMALIEADTPQVNGVLQSFDLVHKGGDEMKLENLLVLIEPVGGSQTGIILERRGDSKVELNPNYEYERKGYLEMAEFFKDLGLNIQIIEETGGTGKGLSVLGKTGEDVVVSTGDRIRVSLKISGEGMKVVDGDSGSTMYEANKYNFQGDEGGYSDISPGTTVKWTVSDVRTTGVIAKGEFVVP